MGGRTKEMRRSIYRQNINENQRQINGSSRGEKNKIELSRNNIENKEKAPFEAINRTQTRLHLQFFAICMIQRKKSEKKSNHI